MSNHNAVYQQQNTVSIPRKNLLKLATVFDLSKTDLKVLLVLMSELNGWNGKGKDPKNFTKVSISSIAETLDIKRDKVEDSMEKLEENNIIERGKNDTVKKGYRFTF